MKNVVPAVLLSAMVALGLSGTASAGIAPSPFQPEINKLHSIELNIAAIGKRLARFNEAETLPAGWENYLAATTNQVDVLSIRLAEALAALPAPSEFEPYDGQIEVIFSLDGIRSDADGANRIIDAITSRMGVEPSPFKIGTIRLIQDIDVHLRPLLPFSGAGTGEAPEN